MVAQALVATARAEPDAQDRAALQAHRQADLARQEIVALIREAPLAPDDLATIRAALQEREHQEQLARAAAAADLVQVARQTTQGALRGPEGTVLATKLGRVYLELKYIPMRRLAV